MSRVRSNFMRPFKLLSLLYKITKNDYASAAEVMSEMHGLPQKMGQHITLYKGTGLDDYFRTLCVSSKAEETKIDEILSNFGLAEKKHSLAAQASIGQVYKVDTLHDPLAVKVRYSGIKKQVKSDLRIIKALVAPLKLTPLRNSYLFPMVDYLREIMLKECAYEEEAKTQSAYHQLFLEDPNIMIPQVIDYSEGAIVSKWIDGDLLLNHNNLVDEWFVRNYLRFLLISLSSLGSLHADPNPGNFIIEPSQKRLVVLDYGSVVVFSPEKKEVLLSLLRGNYKSERELADGLIKLGVPAETIETYYAILGDLVTILLEPFYTQGVYNFGNWRLQYKMNTILASRSWTKPFVIPPDLLMFARVLQGLYFYARKNNVKIDWQEITKNILR